MRFPHQKNHGILRYFYDNENYFYYNIVSINSVNDKEEHSKTQAFDFNSETYWVAEYQTTDVWLSFCLKSYNITLTGYEITTSGGNNRPTKWTFSVSRDGNKYEKEQTETYEIDSKETYYVAYRTNEPYNCFKFKHTGQTQQKEQRCDIAQIEIFGIVSNLKECTFLIKKQFHLLKYLFIIVMLP